jgi:hypothetical protein
VFAIAITLLVLEVAVPAGSEDDLLKAGASPAADAFVAPLYLGDLRRSSVVRWRGVIAEVVASVPVDVSAEVDGVTAVAETAGTGGTLAGSAGQVAHRAPAGWATTSGGCPERTWGRSSTRLVAAARLWSVAGSSRRRPEARRWFGRAGDAGRVLGPRPRRLLGALGCAAADVPSARPARRRPGRSQGRANSSGLLMRAAAHREPHGSSRERAILTLERVEAGPSTVRWWPRRRRTGRMR